jgi:hypothetical protein
MGLAVSSPPIPIISRLPVIRTCPIRIIAITISIGIPGVISVRRISPVWIGSSDHCPLESGSAVVNSEGTPAEHD